MRPAPYVSPSIRSTSGKFTVLDALGGAESEYSADIHTPQSARYRLASNQPFNLTTAIPFDGRSVRRSPAQLRLHPALAEVGWTGAIDEFNDATKKKYTATLEPILITTSGTILSGFGRWQSAHFAGLSEVNCIEYPIGEDETLQFILAHHQTRFGWNGFVRIRLALALKSQLQQKALDNMRQGGRLKGLANLPEAHHIDVRHEIAAAAGVSGRNVSNVETILKTVHPRLIEALQQGTLSINRAVRFCKSPRKEQLEQFIRYSEERATSKSIRRSVPQPKERKSDLDLALILQAIQRQEARQPGSVAIRAGRQARTVVLVGEDLLGELPPQSEFNQI
jgi:ParB-like chromosome segregation protein Spo0J